IICCPSENDLKFSVRVYISVAHRKARKGINPKTKAPLKIPARKVPVFKAGKKLKDAVKK
ncbi:MAG TPA: HU family DNA-binding protein, partial [Candidatus Cloacimonadota bacterium]|nr:HU family DNA-binding protein [Candidatus Cloacimonadota bacterium]